MDDHKVLRMIEAHIGLATYWQIFLSAGLNSGIIAFSEDNDRSNRFALHVSVKQPTHGWTPVKTEQVFRDLVDLRDLADDLTKSGAGEFFDVEINFGTFKDDFIAPLRRTLEEAGLPVPF
jgi:hypothetical protein